MKRCTRFPHKRRYARWKAVEHALVLQRKGEPHVKVFQCTCCAGWHIGRDHARIKLEERQR